MEHESKGKTSTFFQGCSGFSPALLSSELHRVFLETFFQSECVRSHLYLSSAITLTAKVEGESGSLSHALVLFLLHTWWVAKAAAYKMSIYDRD